MVHREPHILAHLQSRDSWRSQLSSCEVGEILEASVLRISLPAFKRTYIPLFPNWRGVERSVDVVRDDPTMANDTEQ